jgi:cyclopropane fatty-acyl-phospholipid synthase-like methyltransferase
MTAHDWSNFWDRYPRRARSGDLLGQVGKTINGVPITEQQLRLLVENICLSLRLSHDDHLLDLCCGNGLLTRLLAEHCCSATGIDFSEPLIEAAREQSAAPNVKYLRMDVRKLEPLAVRNEQRYTKVLCYEALAFLNLSEFDDLLTQLSRLANDAPTILFGSILDRDRIWNFFNTMRRKWFYLFHIKFRRKEVGLGRWWRRQEVVQIANAHGFQCDLLDQPPQLHTAHYRFDAVLNKQ